MRPALLDADVHQNKSGENMQQATLRTAGAIAFTFLMASCAYSQTLNLWPGAAPGSENWTQKEKIVDNTPLGTVVNFISTCYPSV